MPAAWSSYSSRDSSNRARPDLLIQRRSTYGTSRRLVNFVYMWEFHGWKQETSVSDLLSCLRDDPLTDVSNFSLTEWFSARFGDR